MKKRFLSVFILIICCVVLCSCANIEYQRVTDDNGQIMDKLTIELDRTAMLKKMTATKYDKLKKDIEKDVTSYVNGIVLRCASLRREYTNMDFKNGVSAVASEWVTMDGNIDEIFVQVNYANIKFYKLVNGITDDQESSSGSDNEIVSNWFVSKYIMKTSNTFSNIEEYEGDRNFYDYYTNTYDEFNMEDLNLVQIYGTTDSRLKSNADYVEKIDGINYHLWEIDTKDGAYKTCELSYYYLTAVGTGWYVLALGMAVVLAVVLVTIWIVKSVKAKRYKKKVTVVTDESQFGVGDDD